MQWHQVTCNLQLQLRKNIAGTADKVCRVSKGKTTNMAECERYLLLSEVRKRALFGCLYSLRLVSHMSHVFSLKFGERVKQVSASFIL